MGGRARTEHELLGAHAVRPREGGGLIEAEPFFVAFEGPSVARTQLETPRLAASTSGPKDKAMAVMSRGFGPLPGIALPERRPGTDVRQLALTLGLAAVALAIASATGLLAFTWPLLVSPGAGLTDATQAPLVLALVLVGVLAVVLILHGGSPPVLHPSRHQPSRGDHR